MSNQSTSYYIPLGRHRIEIEILRSRFIATVDFTGTVEGAKQFLAEMRAEMPDASHHVYAFRVGHGNSVTEGMSDDGEPTGTAGPPILSILRGNSDIGDISVVVTRYFGGTKLGTGGLVRAYSEATHTILKEMKTEEKVEKRLLGFEVSYSLYEQVKLLIKEYHGAIQDEDFAGNVMLMAQFPLTVITDFQQRLIDLTAGKVEIINLD